MGFAECFLVFKCYLITLTITSSSTIQNSDSNSEANSRPFQDGLRANGFSEAIDPAYTIMVFNDTGTTAQDIGESSSASSDLHSKPKRRKSDPQSWRANQIKRTKAEGKKRCKTFYGLVKLVYLLKIILLECKYHGNL